MKDALGRGFVGQVVPYAPDAYLISLEGAAALAVTEAADTVVAAATVAIGAVLAKTEGADTSAAADTLAIAAQAAKAESADTSTAVAALAIAGQVGVTEGSDTGAATAALAISAGVGATEGADSLLGPLAAQIAALLVGTEGADTVAGTGTVADAPVAPPVVVTPQSGGGLPLSPRRKPQMPPLRVAPPPLRLVAIRAEANIVEAADTCVAAMVLGELPEQRRKRNALRAAILLAA